MKAKRIKSCGEKLLAISANELALAVGISPRHVWRLNAMGKLPKPIRLGGSVRWKVSEIAGWIDSDCPDLQTWEAMKATGKSNGDEDVK